MFLMYLEDMLYYELVELLYKGFVDFVDELKKKEVEKMVVGVNLYKEIIVEFG